MSRIDPGDRCRAAMRLVHRDLDGENLAPAERGARDEHLAACPSCREAAEQLTSICRALREMPRATMPPHAAGRVLRDTVGRPSRPPRQFAWRGMSAAAATLLVAVTAWSLRDGDLPGETVPPGAASLEVSRSSNEAQVAAAAHDIRLAFALAAREIDRTEKVAMDRVNDRFAPALARVPLFNSPGESSR